MVIILRMQEWFYIKNQFNLPYSKNFLKKWPRFMWEMHLTESGIHCSGITSTKCDWEGAGVPRLLPASRTNDQPCTLRPVSVHLSVLRFCSLLKLFWFLQLFLIFTWSHSLMRRLNAKATLIQRVEFAEGWINGSNEQSIMSRQLSGEYGLFLEATSGVGGPLTSTSPHEQRGCCKASWAAVFQTLH